MGKIPEGEPHTGSKTPQEWAASHPKLQEGLVPHIRVGPPNHENLSRLRQASPASLKLPNCTEDYGLLDRTEHTD